MAQVASAKFRRMHLGVDYGTAWSKLVLRDMEAPAGEPEAFVLRPAAQPGDFRFPSLLSYFDGRLFFGWKAEEIRQKQGASVYPSVKMRMVDDVLKGFHAPAAALPEGLDEEDLAVLTVLYLLQEGFVAARDYAAKRGAVPKLSMTLGVPMTPRCYPQIQAIFTRVAWRALAVLREGRTLRMQESGLHVFDAQAATRWSRHGMPESLDPNGWVRSEAGAALHWAVSSPQVEDGLYAAIDVGAGTLSTSVFNIVATFDPGANIWVKKSIAVFGASCGAPSMDRIDEILASHVPGRDGPSFRGQEDHFSERIDGRREFIEVLARMNRTRREAFKQAFKSHRSQSAWETRRFKGAFLFGGGHKVDALRKRSRQSAFKFDPDPYPERRLEWPRDLVVGVESNGRWGRADAALASDLLVAYGLSFPHASVFPVEDPESIEPMSINSLYGNLAWRDRDDLYAK